MQRKKMPDWLVDKLNDCPTKGSGVHQWLYSTARQLHAHYNPEEMVRILQSKCTDKHRIREVREAVKDSAATAWGNRGGCTPQIDLRGLPTGNSPRWPEPVLSLGRATAEQHACTLEQWKSVSPEKITEKGQADHWMSLLFPGNPLICCQYQKKIPENHPDFIRMKEWGSLRHFPAVGWTRCHDFTEHLDVLLPHLHKIPQIVPNPMTAKLGKTKQGRLHAHSLDNTGPRVYLVVEFDDGGVDYQASIIHFLAYKMPLTMILHSGGKSIHAWFYVEGRHEDDLRYFMNEARLRGADVATWSRTQLVRVPDGKRTNSNNGYGNRQRVYFFNPSNTRGAV